MILERVEKDGSVEAIYESANIVASSYNKNKKDLNITFKHGGNYTYQNVSQTDYMRFETAESQGKVLNTNIKKYAFLKHENKDVDLVIKKIKELKSSELSAMEVGLVNVMKEAISLYESSGMLGSDMIDNINKVLNVYNKTASQPKAE